MLLLRLRKSRRGRVGIEDFVRRGIDVSSNWF